MKCVFGLLWKFLDYDGKWLDFEGIYRGVLFGFLKEKYFPVFKMNETSKTSVSMRFVSSVIERLSSLNMLIRSFLNLSTLGPFRALGLCVLWRAHRLYINLHC